MKLVACAAASLIVACSARGARPAPPSQSVAHEVTWAAPQVDTLIRLGREDQEGRGALAQAMVRQDTAVMLASMRADSAHTRWLRTAVARYGWPIRSSVGDSAATSAWLILQHSPDTAWQAAMLPELEQLGRRGELRLPDVALLTDRVLVHRGEPQRYGSQFNIVDGRLVPAPIADLPGLNARRASVELPPMTEYVRMLSEQMKLPVSWPPTQ